MKLLNSLGDTVGPAKVIGMLECCKFPDMVPVKPVIMVNNWNETEAQMKKLKNGDFKLTLDLSSENEYRYRYLIDSSRWENDWQADSYVPNPFGCEDSIIKV